jgi:hypothetical protein
MSRCFSADQNVCAAARGALTAGAQLLITSKFCWRCTERSIRHFLEFSASHSVLEQALGIHREDEHLCRLISRIGAQIMPSTGDILTHCNTVSWHILTSVSYLSLSCHLFFCRVEIGLLSMFLRTSTNAWMLQVAWPLEGRAPLWA